MSRRVRKLNRFVRTQTERIARAGEAACEAVAVARHDWLEEIRYAGRPGFLRRLWWWCFA